MLSGFVCCLNHHYFSVSLHLLQTTVQLLHCLIVQNGVMGLIIGFTHIVLVKYVTNTHVSKQGILRLLSESGQTNRAAPIPQLNFVILATLREYSNSFLY